MPRNKIQDLNNHLFDQLERLSDSDLNLDIEITRAKAMSSIAKNIIESHKVTLQALEMLQKEGVNIAEQGKAILSLDTPKS